MVVKIYNALHNINSTQTPPRHFEMVDLTRKSHNFATSTFSALQGCENIVDRE